MKVLKMKFRNQLDKNFILNIPDIKDDLKSDAVTKVMDDIIAKKVFVSTGGDLVKKLGAEIVDTSVTKLF